MNPEDVSVAAKAQREEEKYIGIVPETREDKKEEGTRQGTIAGVFH